MTDITAAAGMANDTPAPIADTAAQQAAADIAAAAGQDSRMRELAAFMGSDPLEDARASGAPAIEGGQDTRPAALGADGTPAPATPPAAAPAAAAPPAPASGSPAAAPPVTPAAPAPAPLAVDQATMVAMMTGGPVPVPQAPAPAAGVPPTPPAPVAAPSPAPTPAPSAPAAPAPYDPEAPFQPFNPTTMQVPAQIEAALFDADVAPETRSTALKILLAANANAAATVAVRQVMQAALPHFMQQREAGQAQVREQERIKTDLFTAFPDIQGHEELITRATHIALEQRRMLGQPMRWDPDLRDKIGLLARGAKQAFAAMASQGAPAPVAPVVPAAPLGTPVPTPGQAYMSGTGATGGNPAPTRSGPVDYGNELESLLQF